MAASKKTTAENKAMLIRATKSRMFLFFSGFLSEKENESIKSRLRKFGVNYKVKITQQDIYGK